MGWTPGASTRWSGTFAGSTDTIGADPRILDALDAAGIPYFFLLP